MNRIIITHKKLVVKKLKINMFKMNDSGNDYRVTKLFKLYQTVI